MATANESSPPASGIGQFWKRMRSRSKSPSANQRIALSPQQLTPAAPAKVFNRRSESSKSPMSDGHHRNGHNNPFGNLMARLSGRRRRNISQPLLDLQTSGRAAVSEEDLVSKSLASDIELGLSPLAAATTTTITTNHHRSSAVASPHCFSYSQETLLIETPRRQPSYIGISCALSGYRRPVVHSLASTPCHHRFAPSLVERRLQQLTSPPSTPHSGTDEPSTITTPAAVRQLVADFDRLKLTSTTKRRPIGAPPIPPIRRSVLSPIVSDATGSSSSAPTVSCVTGPLTTSTQDGSSLVDDVMRVIDHNSQMISSSIQMTESIANNISAPITDNAFDDDELVIPTTTGATRDGHFYAQLADSKRRQLEEMCAKANADLDGDTLIPEYASDTIRVAVGKAGLLMRKKITKFDELIDKNLNPIENDSRPATIDDLEGYWALIEIELNDISSEFRKVNALRADHWQLPATCENHHSQKDNGDIAPIPPIRRTIRPSQPPPKLSTAKDDQRRIQLAEAKRVARQRLDNTNNHHNDENIEDTT